MTREKRSETALARLDESVLARRRVDTGFVGALDEELRRPDGKARAMSAILEAARALAPVFSVTSVKDPEGQSRDDDETHPIESTETVVEILFSAGAYLARARGMTKAELMAKLDEWARDNGYD